MTDIQRASLFGKLSPLSYKAIESATTFCKLRGNPYVELVHWMHQVLQGQDSDLHRAIKQFNIEPARLAGDMTAALDRLPRGSTSLTDLSAHLDEMVREGWVYSSLMFGGRQVRFAHMLIGILKVRHLRAELFGISQQFEKLSLETMIDRFEDVFGGSPEEDTGGPGASAAVPGEASGAMSPAAMGKGEALEQFTTDLTEQARSGELDPIVGRDDEIRQIIDILMRRRQNNPVLVGEAGVGKTAVVEGFAQRIARGDVPPMLEDVALRVLDVGLLQAGASMKGEFEQRLRQVIEEVQSSPKPIILFIDEAHTLVGAGGAAGTGDAANLLKPALARGTLRTVAATTWAEYKKHIEKDPALTRRFQTVQVDEPDEARALLMMRGVASTMERHHKAQILDEALEASVRLSSRYIPARQLPDKSVSLLDTAAARVMVSQYAVPPSVDDARKRIQALETELEIIAREENIGIAVAPRRAAAEAALADERDRLTGLEARWIEEKRLVDQILELRAKLRAGREPVEGTGTPLEQRAEAEAGEGEDDAAKGEGGEGTEPVLVTLSDDERKTATERLTVLQAELEDHQGEDPLVLPTVDAQAVATVVADWTGIPVGRMVKDEIGNVLELATNMGQRVIGQDHALEAIARRIQTSRAGLDNPNKPIGVFLLAGPSGVGKTETALALAENLYGGEENVITINMSEFQEAHTVSTLKGSPPGYVGYGEGGVLTEAVRRRPYSVVLLDEIEKAHGDVHELFFQVFDKGVMEDGEGRRIDFRNTIILLTSNVGSDLILSMCNDPDLMPDAEAVAKALRKPMLDVFPAALLGRTVTVPYYPLDDARLSKIVRLQLDRVARRVEGAHRVPFQYGDDVVSLILGRCAEVESGGRVIDNILTNTVLPTVSRTILEKMMREEKVQSIELRVADGDFAYDIK